MARIAGLLRPIKAGVHSKLLICIVTVCAGYTFTYAGSPLLRLAAISIFFVSAEIMVYYWTSFFAQSLMDAFKLMFLGKNVVSWAPLPEAADLAAKMGVKLHKERPFGIRDGFNNAYANLWSKQIIVGRDLWDRLERDERLALMAHELTHIRKGHGLAMFLPGLLAILVLATLPMAADIVGYLTAASVYVVGFVLVSWKNEYDADAGAAANSGREATVSLLTRIVPPSQRARDSETHPSVSSRISRLR